ncbi:MAG: type II toxin-antitoxin system VapC family toxin [Candidatus Sigynarchaeota archaeon]
MTITPGNAPCFLDAEACIAMLKGKAGIKKVLEKITNPLATTTPALFEVHCGIQYYKKKGLMDKEARSLALLDKLLIFNLDSNAAKIAGEIWADLKLNGKMIKIIDVLIGAIMLSHGYHQIISNDDHFSIIDGIVRIGYII